MNDYELHQLVTNIKIGTNRVNTLQFLRDLAIDLHRIAGDMIAYYDKHEQDMFIENRLNYLYTIANLQEEIDYYLDIMQNNFWAVD